ncbi:phage/plasmid primase, P4 family [Azospirillum doebereinerae]|uniref:DNA primase family protein n=1 Tax=Azospirillum doebereinerae TaxID=92933 RepID=UPI001EE5956A|nr:phage/plasmid primase, P4 family [Azospirillum doebereinerae]MCG5239540.1 phage/plasmid primase, P4 family [Azospirillum doebereinerae]
MPDDIAMVEPDALDDLRQQIDDAVAVDPGSGGGSAAPPPEDEDGEPPPDRELATYDQSDKGNGERLIQRYGNQLVWVDGSGWAVWDGKRFAYELGEGAATKLCHRMIEKLRDELKELRDLGPPPAPPTEVDEPDPMVQGKMRLERIKDWERGLKAFETFAVKAGDTPKVKGALAQAMPYLSKPARAMDSNPWLLTVDNGTLDLRQKPDTLDRMHLAGFRRANLITRLAGAAFNPQAVAPQFDRFITRILPDEEVRRFVQKLLGYCLTGDTSEQIFVIFYGTGKNGKSKLVDLIRKIFNDYAATIPAGVFLDAGREKKADGPKPSIAKLPGVRLVLMSEPDKGEALSEGLVKEVTGGEPMETRKLNKDPFEFRPEFTPVMVTNHRPIIRGQDVGIWRRVILVPFEVFITPEERDPHILDKLMEEKEGVLNWLLNGLWLWLDEGLDPPAKIMAAVEEYKRDQDPLGDFLEAETAGIQGKRVTATALYEAYTKWCERNAVEPLKQNGFGRKMKDRGFRTVKSCGVNEYVGLCLLDGLPQTVDAPPPEAW